MDSAAGIIAAIVIAAALVGGAAIAQLAYQESAPGEDTTETFDTGGIGTSYTVNVAGEVYYDDTVNVTNESGVVMVEPTDYTWDEQNGTLTVESSRLANENNTTLAYQWARPTEQQAQFASQLARLFDAGYALPLILIFALVILGVTTLGGLS